jgi:hypothetical protein
MTKGNGFTIWFNFCAEIAFLTGFCSHLSITTFCKYLDSFQDFIRLLPRTKWGHAPSEMYLLRSERIMPVSITHNSAHYAFPSFSDLHVCGS